MMILILSLLLLAVLGYTIYALTNHKDLYAEATELARTVPMNQLQSQDKGLGGTIWVCFLAGALLTGAFAVQFFSGADDPATYTKSQFVYAGIGCMMTLAITLAQKSLYSSIHTTRAGLLITFLILLFVIFSEIATSSERTDLLVKHRSESSQVYQGVLGEINRPTAPANVNTSGLAAAQAELADAEYELGRCDRHASKGTKRVERCKVYEEKRIAKAQGKINAISGQNEMLTTKAVELKLQLVDKAKELQYDEEQNPAIIKFLKAVFGGAILYSMMFASLIAVVAFESAFHFTGTRRAVIRHAMLLKQGINDEVKQSAPLAQKKTERAQWNSKLAESGVESPADPAMNQQADKAQIERIVERGQNTVPAVPEQSKTTVYTVAEQSEQPKPEQPKYASDTALYQAWKSEVLDGEIGTTARGCKQVIESHRGEKISMRSAYPIWNAWGEKGLEEGFLIVNPDHTPTNKKPKYILAKTPRSEYLEWIGAKRKNGHLGTEEEQLNII